MKNAKRNYAAASNIARYADFTRSSGSADVELMKGLAEVRRKCRDLARNSGTMKRYIQLMKDNVVGEHGFSVQIANKSVENAWKEWCNQPTVDGDMTMVDLLDLAVASVCRDGEFFFEFVADARYPDSLAVNPLEADLVDDTLNLSRQNGNRVKMGVELDALNKPVAYWVLREHPGDTAAWSNYDGRSRHRRVPADKIVHVYQRLRAGQTRGEPPASATVNSIKMLDGYREAETMNRRIAAAMMGFFYRDQPKPSELDALADEGDGESEEEPLMMYADPGTFKQLPDGMRFDKFDPGGSQTDYADYESQVKKDISMGLGISAFSLGMETAGVSYSTGRSVLMEDRAFYKKTQAFFIRKVMMRIYARWCLTHSLSPNSTIAPTKLNAIMSAAKFRGRGWPWIDPAKDIQANALALETYQTSYSQIAADRGMDVMELFEEIKKDREIMAQFGLQPVEAQKPKPAGGDEEE